jgi:tol-pal system protein YbgF
VRRTLHHLQLLLLATILLAGCMPPQPPRLEQDLDEMKRRLAANEQTVVALRKDMSGQGSGQLDNLNRSQADLKADLDALRAESLAQSGKFDDLHSVIQAQQSQLQRLRDELDFKIKAIEERLARLEAELAKKPSVPQAEASPEALYQQGLDAIRSGADLARGRQLLKEFASKYPQHNLTINAKYWIGEAWYGEKKYENAILQFQDVIQEYGDHPKVAAALLKQALSFQALGDKENGRVILNKLVERFPLADEAKKAKELLAH